MENKHIYDKKKKKKDYIELPGTGFRILKMDKLQKHTKLSNVSYNRTIQAGASYDNARRF